MSIFLPQNSSHEEYKQKKNLLLKRIISSQLTDDFSSLQRKTFDQTSPSLPRTFPFYGKQQQSKVVIW